MTRTLLVVTIALAVLIYGLSAFAADCDATIAQTDKIGDVQGKLSCFSTENARLRREIESLRSSARSVTAPRIHLLTASSANQSNVSPEQCKSRAVSAVTERGGVVVAAGEKWIDLELNENGLMIECGTSGWGGVIVAGPGLQKLEELARLLATLVFGGR